MVETTKTKVSSTGRKGRKAHYSSEGGMDEHEREVALSQEQYLDKKILADVEKLLETALMAKNEEDQFMTRPSLSQIILGDKKDNARMIRRSLKLLEAKGMIESDRTDKAYRYRWLGNTLKED